MIHSLNHHCREWLTCSLFRFAVHAEHACNEAEVKATCGVRLRLVLRVILASSRIIQIQGAIFSNTYYPNHRISATASFRISSSQYYSKSLHNLNWTNHATSGLFYKLFSPSLGQFKFKTRYNFNKTKVPVYLLVFHTLYRLQNSSNKLHLSALDLTCYSTYALLHWFAKHNESPGPAHPDHSSTTNLHP